MDVSLFVAARGKRLRLKTDQFDQRAREVFGDEPDYRIAERLGIDNSSFSLIRKGKRYAPTSLVNRVTAAMPGVDLDELFEVVDVEADAA